MDNTVKNVQLMDSIKKGQLSLVRFLIADGADVNYVNDKGKTPLQEAEATGNRKMVELLLERGANSDERKLSRQMPIVRRKKRSFREIHEMMESTKPNVQRHPVPNSVGETYTKRSGTAAVGELFEKKLLTMVLFRLLHDDQIESFYLGTNVDETGAFDDVVLRTSFGGKSHVYCLQAKHRKAGSSVNFNDLINMRQAKGDFHLSKYFDSYLKIRGMFSPISDHVIFQGDYEQTELELIMFTPAKLTFHGCKVEYESVAVSNIFCSNQTGKALQIKYTQALQECFKDSVRTAVAEIIAKFFLLHNYETTNLKDAIKNLKFSYASLMQMYRNQQVMAVSHNRSKLLSLRIAEILEEPLLPSPKEHVEIVKNFLSKFRFYSEQNTEDALDEIMIREIISKNYECEQLIYAKSYEAVENWWKRPGQVPYLTKSCDFYKAAVCEVKLYKNISYGSDSITSNLFKFSKRAMSSSKWADDLRDFVENKQSFLNIFGSTPKLSCLKIAQFLKENSIYCNLVCINSNNFHETLENLKKTRSYKITIVYLPDINHDETPSSSRFANKFILITKQVYRGDWHSIQDESQNLLDFEIESQEKVLDVPVTFQGISIALRSIMGKVPRETVDAVTLQTLIYGDTLEISCISLSKDNDDSSGYYIARDRLVNHQNEPKAATGISDKVVIVAADPGMGKSTFLTGFAKALKRENPACWIVRINLLNYSKQFSLWCEKRPALNENLALNFLIGIMSSDKSKTDTFERKIFEWYCKQFKLILLIDGFDEMSPYYVDIVVQLIKLYKANFTAKLWVTTRTGEIQKSLEECHGNTYSLENFTSEEMKQFLRNYWTLKLKLGPDTEKMLQAYIEQLVSNWSDKIDGVMELISVPLHTKMLAMVFQEDFLAYCHSSDYRMVLGKWFSVQLYEQFVKLMYNEILNQEKNENDIYKPHNRLQREEGFHQFITHHKNAAVYTLFKQSDVREVMTLAEIRAVKDFLEKVPISVESTGIITRVVDGKPIFLHHTYAEYFAAMFIWEMFCSISKRIKQFIGKILIDFLIGCHQNQIAKFLHEIAKVKQHNSVTNLATKATVLFSKLQDVLPTYYKEPSFCYLLGLVEFAISSDRDCFQSISANVRGLPERILGQASSMFGSSTSLNWLNDRAKFHTRMFFLNACKGGYFELVGLTTDNLSINVRSNDFSSFDFTALYFAASGGHFKVVKHLLDNSASVDEASQYGLTALHSAAENGYFQIIQLLLANGADVNLTDDAGTIALHLAAQKGYNRIVALLLENGSMVDKAAEITGRTALYFASKEGHLEIVRTLLRQSANVNVESKDDETPLHIATQNGRLNVVQTLLENGADPNAETVGGFTPLHLAAIKNLVEIAFELLYQGAFIDTASAHLHMKYSNCTPLQCAVLEGNLKMVNLLIEYGANVHFATENEGLTLLHFAAMANSKEIVTILLEHGCNVDSLCHDDKTPLHEACLNCNFDVAQVLLERGANAHHRTSENGFSLLHIAAQRNCPEIIQLLIDNGVDINCTTSIDFQTALYEAFRYFASDAAKLLVKLGADPAYVNPQIMDS